MLRDRLRRRILRAASTPRSLRQIATAELLRLDHAEVLVRELVAEGSLVERADGFAAAQPGPTRPDRAALEERARHVIGRRPAPDPALDQVHLDAPSLVRRAEWLLHTEDAPERDVLFLGDDDFSSLLVAGWGPGRVVVADIDRRVLDEVGALAEELGVEVERVQLDLREARGGLPPEIARVMDLVVTDPPYTEAGALWFTACASAALRPRLESTLAIAVPWLVREHWSDELLAAVQAWLLRRGFVLTDVLRGFGRYHSDDAIQSSLVVARQAALDATSDPFEGLDPTRLYTRAARGTP